MEMLEVIFSRPQMWMALPALSFRFDFRATIFRVLSRLGACVTELYGHQHTLFPVRMFLLLKSKDHAAAILSTPPCVRGDWADNFIRKHPGLDTDECFFQLTAVAMLWPTDIGMTESRHASIRRVLESRSLQTHRLQFKHLSAEWTLQQSRLGARAAGSGIGRAPKYRRRAAGALVGARGDALVRGGRPARKDSAQPYICLAAHSFDATAPSLCLPLHAPPLLLLREQACMLSSCVTHTTDTNVLRSACMLVASPHSACKRGRVAFV